MYEINLSRVQGTRNPMIYGHFIEHFHRQIYDGIFDPASPLADENGLRKDVVKALRDIKVPIVRWPGGCFVSSYNWRYGVGERKAVFDKAWRIEDPNTFGTDEFIAFCKAVGCDPYICTNAGTGTGEEMSDWLEYCNLEKEGFNAKSRIENGSTSPFDVKYWSIGNENYGDWEIGAKTSLEWGRYVAESAKMMKRVDPSIELSAAALADIEWNIELLKNAGDYLDWISIHEYWDPTSNDKKLATYEECMAYTANLDSSVKKVLGILEATGYIDKIKISFDEWNLRGWYHPNAHGKYMPVDKQEYITPRDKNDDNSSYTMADAVFTACFLNMLNRYCNHIQMANFAPTVNTRGVIYTHPQGIVKRSTYHVFDLYVNYLGNKIVDVWNNETDQHKMKVKSKKGETKEIDVIDLLATVREDGKMAIAIVNKHPEESQKVSLKMSSEGRTGVPVLYTISGNSKDDYNDVDRPDQ
ncbi:MAG: alpha-N-arabinofuranosidase, partial [Clostridiales bacterium]|nr:alpha-N-arabinofuranosidase [Clostridiales bacterium]